MMLLNQLSSPETEAGLKPPGPPNHLIESQIFRKTGKNNLIRIIPEKVLFTGFQPNVKMEKIVKILNISSQRQRFHILPPQTEFFKIVYKKKEGPHVPGMAIPVTISFTPKAWKTYSDCIRIHCPENEENLLIPLHAYPSVDTSSVPRRIDFHDIKLGHSVNKKFTIWSKSNLTVKFSATMTGSNSFKLIPSGEGEIPSGNSQEFKIIYNPKEYCIKMAEMKLLIESGNVNIDNSEIVIDISGNCKSPNLPDVLEVAEQRLNKDLGRGHQHQANKSKHRATLSKKTSKNSKNLQQKNFTTTMDAKSFNAPQTIHTQHGVNKLLLHGNRSANYITHSFQPVDETIYKSYKTEENLFLKQLNINKKLEQSCRIKWLERKGQQALSGEERDEIVLSRNLQISEDCFTVVKEISEIPGHNNVKYMQGRIRREADKVIEIPDREVRQDSNDWWKRRHIRSKFRKAANKVIYRNRANRVIRMVKLLAEERMLKAKIAEEERLEYERLNKAKDPLQELLNRLIPVEDINYDSNFEKELNDKIFGFEPLEVDLGYNHQNQHNSTDMAGENLGNNNPDAIPDFLPVSSKKPSNENINLGNSMHTIRMLDLDKVNMQKYQEDNLVEENEINQRLKELESMEIIDKIKGENLETASLAKTKEVLDQVMHAM